MKKFTKVCLIIAAVCLVLGIGLTSAAGAMGVRLRDLPSISYGNHWYGNHWYGDWDDWENDWDDWEDEWVWRENLNPGIQSEITQAIEEIQTDVSGAVNDVQAGLSGDMKELHEELDSYWNEPLNVIETTDFTGIRNLDVEVQVGGIQIIAVDADDVDGDLVNSNAIRVKVGDGDELGQGTYRIYVDDGNKLCVETRWKNKKHNMIMDDRQTKSRRIQILVPRGYQFDEVDLEVNAGALKADEVFARSLDAKMNAGSMIISNGDVQELDSEINAGELVYQGNVSRSLEGECRAGSLDIKLKGKKENYDYEVSASAGAVTVGDESFSSLKSRKIRNTGASAKMDLSCMAGSIVVTFAE